METKLEQPNAIMITIDVEDWFQVENFKPWIPYSSWPKNESRVQRNTERLLDLFSSSSHFQNNLDGCLSIRPKATFFVLGWVAERLPHLVRRIHDSGHEVASHGYHHHLCHHQSPSTLKNDLLDSKKLLEDIIGAPVYGYRAPSFSINENAMKILKECGYLYDTSANSFELNKRYGKIDLSQKRLNGIAIEHSNGFFELPISNLTFINRTLPWGGGGYFRLIPFSIFRYGVKKYIKENNAYLFYMHPWEIDNDQPIVKQASPFFKFRHYYNLKNTYLKLSKLIQAFKNSQFMTCFDYLKSQYFVN